MAENYVCTALKKEIDSVPYYWTSDGKAEIDFVIDHVNVIIPIEVKSGNATKAKSLAVYKELYHPELRVRISNLNLRLTEDLLNIPMFYADYTKYFISKALNL